MTRFVLAVLLTAAIAAHAQQPVYRCVDQNNRQSFSDKPGPGCKPTQPLPPAPKAEAKGAKADAKKKSQAQSARAETAAQRCARIQGQLTDLRGEQRKQATRELEGNC